MFPPDPAPPDDQTLASESEASGRLLGSLSASGDLDRLVGEARRLLAGNPDDLVAHFYLAIALIDLDRYEEARLHVDVLLSKEPDEIRSQVAAVSWFSTQGKWRMARKHLAEGMRLDPDLAYFPRTAALGCFKEMKFKEARELISRARELDPHDPEIANLYIRIHGATETSAADAIKRLGEYHEALALDPTNGLIHNSIGDVYLEELEDPVKAEQHYRHALLDDPSNRTFQLDLFEAVAKRSLIYCIFSIPSRTFRWMGYLAHAVRQQPWRLILFLLGIKVVIGFLLWLTIATSILWPGAKLFEWLMISEIREGSGASIRHLRLWHAIRRWPIWVRWTAFLSITVSVWWLLFMLVGLPAKVGFTVVGVVLLVHAAVVCCLRLRGRLRAWWSRRKLAA